MDESASGVAVKFILVKVSGAQGSRIVLRSSRAEYHKGIYNQFVSEIGAGFDLEVIGGGRLLFDKHGRKIMIWGSSSAFGPPDYNRAKKLLENSYRGFEIVLKKESP